MPCRAPPPWGSEMMSVAGLDFVLISLPSRQSRTAGHARGASDRAARGCVTLAAALRRRWQARRLAPKHSIAGPRRHWPDGGGSFRWPGPARASGCKHLHAGAPVSGPAGAVPQPGSRLHIPGSIRRRGTGLDWVGLDWTEPDSYALGGRWGMWCRPTRPAACAVHGPCGPTQMESSPPRRHPGVRAALS
jgi:hypothetical protein